MAVAKSEDRPLSEAQEPMLSPQEATAAEKTQAPPTSLAALFRFATPCEKVLAVVLLILALAQGSLLPLQANFFQPLFMSIAEPDPSIRARKVREAVLIFVALGTASFLLTIVCYAGLSFIGDRISARLRTRFFQHLLTKDVGWYDTHKTAEMATRLTQDTFDFREGCGAKLAIFAGSLVTVPVGFAVAFVKSWQITLILFAFTPFLGIAMGRLMKATQKAGSSQQEAYAKAGGVAETAISGIRTVQAFCGFQREVAKYDALLAEAEKDGVASSRTVGCVLAFFIAMLYLLFASGFWIGAFFVVDDWKAGCWQEGSGPPFGNCMDGGAVLGAIMGIMLGASGFAQLGTCVSAVSSAKSAAGRIYAIIDEPPRFALEEGQTLTDLRGEVKFKDVTFCYPTRPEQPALCRANILVKVGQTAAFVGPSGSGKTTVIALLQRFYDPASGAVCIDGHDIRGLSLKWLRQQMGLVQQEPVLFSGTIEDNIRYGREGGASDEEVVAAAKLANAHSFIMDKADMYKTQVGERGSTLSGGQKQRVAIARAMVRDPKILLLDEATSALDNESEKVVQAALDELLVSKPRTTLVVAHRLSTIQNVHVINVLENGALKEVGTHEELLERRGLYHELWELSARSMDGAPDVSGSAQQVLPRAVSQVSRQSSIKESAEPAQAAQEDTKALPEDTKEVSNGAARLFAMQKSSLKWLVLGGIGSAASSVASPFLGSLFSESMGIITVAPVVDNHGHWEDIDFDHVRKEASIAFAKFASVAVGMGIATFLAQSSFRRASEALLRKVRRDTFEAMLRQETAFFDERTSGALSDRLAQDPPKLKAFTGESLSGVVGMTLTLIAALTLALSKSPLLTGTLLAMMPVLMLGHGLVQKFTVKKNETAAGPIVSEAMGNIRTVASYSLEQEMMTKYEALLATECKQERRTSTMSGIAAAYQSAMGFYLYAVLFLFANIYITHCGMEQTAVLGTIFPLLFSVGALSQGSAFFMDRVKGQQALQRIFNTLDHASKINGMCTEGGTLQQVRGEITFQSVKFAYPTRPGLMVFKRFDLTIEAGKQVAFVGHSGSGKSTAVCLVQRFYDPMEGTVLLDGTDIRTLNLQWLRRQMGMVQQEPLLFAGSVAENVRYGREDASDAEIEEVCKSANAHGFILKLEAGYATEVGERGAQLSGGQKQRIAIARALIRDPKILLLDEATSALDNESERLVQESLDQLLLVQKRTTLVVAHRLSTIASADTICFIHEGRIVEKGSYAELMAIPDGHFRKLAERQEAEAPAL